MTGSDRTPEISVCVATRNRAQLLPRLVSALERQSLDPNRFEVVFADDASTDATVEILEALKRRSSVRIRIVKSDARGGPASARNRAWRSALAPLVAFTDDDCVPTPGWLAAHVISLARVDISQGKVVPDPARMAAAGPLDRWIGVEDENGLYETCNISYRKAWLEHVGGFDPSFRRAGEDADLAWRAKDAGATSTFTPEALVHHDVDRFSWGRELRNTRRWAGVLLLVERHPHLRRRFGEGRPWRGAHRPVVVAAGGLVFGCWGIVWRKPLFIALGAAATAPYAWYRFHTDPLATSRRQRLLCLVPLLTLDLSEVAVIAATRARLVARSLVRRWRRRWPVRAGTRRGHPGGEPPRQSGAG